MLFDLQRGIIEVEGEEEFVDKVYSDLRPTLLAKVSDYTPTPHIPEAISASNVTDEEPKKTRKRTKSTGPSCPSRIEDLKAEGFFKELRSSKEISGKLREKGKAYEGKRIAAALHNLTSAGKLGRMQEGGVWKYQNP